TVTVREEINPTSGMFMNILTLQEYMKETILELLDHKNLDQDVPHFADVVSTTEDLAVYICTDIPLEGVSGGCPKVKIYEFDKNFIVYKAE
ncbi:unnamed protein product, partial [Natator depressus]